MKRLAWCALLLAACSFDWDGLQPAVSGATSGASSSNGSTNASSSDASSTSASTASAGGAGGTGGVGTGGGVGGDGDGGNIGGGGAGGGGPLGAWQNVQPVAALASSGDDDDPTLSDDLLELYFNSERAGGAGQVDIYRSRRGTVGDPWAPAELVAELSTASRETNPVLSGDGLTIWIAGRYDGQITFDIYVSTRASRNDAWSTPVLETATLNEPNLADLCGRVMSDGLTMYHNRNATVRLAQRGAPQDPWGVLQSIPSLGDVFQPWVSDDQLTMYFDEGPTDEHRIWRTSRPTTGDPWATPSEVMELNVSLSEESDAWLSPDQRYMMFAVGTTGNRQLWEASR